MKLSVLENFLVEVQGMEEEDARLKVVAELKTVEAEYTEYQEAGKYGLYTHGITRDEIIRREIIRKKNVRESVGVFGMKNYLPESREKMAVASDAMLFPILESVVWN